MKGGVPVYVLAGIVLIFPSFSHNHIHISSEIQVAVSGVNKRDRLCATNAN